MYVQFSFYYGLQSLGFISNNWIEYNSTRAPALYARLSLHSQHQLRWGNNPQQISICTINKSINHAPTCAINKCINHAPTCTINKCIQPCTKYVPIMCQLLIKYDSSICTNIINYTPHVCVPTHQLLVSTMYSTCTSTKIPHQFHHPNMICSFVIDLVYMITFLQTFLDFKNKRLAFSSNFSLVSHD